MKNALVTGAAGGVGTAVATDLHSRGWRVALLDVDRESIAELATALDPQGSSAVAVPVDLTDEAAVSAAVASVTARWERLDGVASCAGIATRAAPFADTSIQTWRQSLDVNLMGVVHVLQAALPVLRPEAAIVIVSSVAGLRARAGLSAYCAAKAAAVSLTQTLALELAERRIRVNCIAPGSLDTAMFAQFGKPGESQEDMLARYSPGIPLGRLGTAREVAEAVRFLIEYESSSFMTGQVVTVDGGRSL